MLPVEIAGIPNSREMTAACVPLPAPGAPNKISFIETPLLLEEALVLAHHHLRLQRADRLKCNTDNDDDRGTADGEAGVAQQFAGDQRADGHDAEVDGAEKGDLVENLGNEVRRGLARTEAGDEAAVALEVVGDLNGVKLNGSVEIAEADDHQEVDDQIQHRLGVDRVVDAAANGALLGSTDESPDGGGQGRDGLREDDGQNAGHVHLHGKGGCLAAVHLAADLTLGVLDGDAALCFVDVNDQNDHCKHTDQQQSDPQITDGALAADVAARHGDHVGHAGQNACKQDNGDTVADTEFIDLLAQPHDEGRTCNKGNDDHRKKYSENDH